MSEKNNTKVAMMITGPASNSGKTAVTCGLLAAMKSRGRKTCAFKCGPDYIDPMFHRSVLGIESRNLDLFLAGENGVRDVFASGSRGMDAVICEGVMGYYDGITDRASAGAPEKASAWHLSTLLGIPSILVLRPKGSALTLAAVIRGMTEFRSPSNIAGVILNDCSPSYYEAYSALLEEEGGVPILGYLPHMEEAEFDSRHLGLMTASEIGDLRERIDCIAETMEETLDWGRLMGICSGWKGNGFTEKNDPYREGDEAEPVTVGSDLPRIGVARDEAFCFIYEETIEALKRAGAEPVFFSPLVDEKLPEGICGLYLPGGYPELYGEKLASNESMRKSVADGIEGGLPAIAECGGFLYLGTELEDDEGRTWPMCGCLRGSSKNAGHLVRFGYGYIAAHEDCMLFRRGEKIPVHEFHYWDTTDNGSDMELIKARDGSSRRFGYCSDSLYAGFPHLYMAGDADLAARFVAAAEAFGDR